MFQKYFKSFFLNKNLVRNHYLNELINSNNKSKYSITKRNVSIVFIKKYSITPRYVKDIRKTYQRNISTKNNELDFDKLKKDQTFSWNKLNSNLAREFINTLTIEERKIIKQELANLEKESPSSQFIGIYIFVLIPELKNYF
jgi:hypothetical protein